MLQAVLIGPTRPTLNCPCSSAVEHSLGKGEVSGSSPDEGMAKSIAMRKKVSIKKSINIVSLIRQEILAELININGI